MWLWWSSRPVRAKLAAAFLVAALVPMAVLATVEHRGTVLSAPGLVAFAAISGALALLIGGGCARRSVDGLTDAWQRARRDLEAALGERTTALREADQALREREA